ncbi:glycosyltransferase family 2 protein [Candidatus Dependentiae bacterium]|nr:glycosyltransferase family 2 protein [Candidatus Dependentiae bacterium]
MKKISFIIPVYNEGLRIEKTLEDLKQYFIYFSYDYEIVIVDDGSFDSTSDIIKKFMSENSSLKIRLLNLNKNAGKGAAVRFGMMNAGKNSDLYFFMDSDLSTPLFEIDKFIRKFIETGTDIIIGSRSLPESNVLKRQNTVREYMGRFFNKIVKFLICSDFIDTQCGFKMFSNKIKDKIFSKLKIDGFSFDVEIIVLSKKYNIKILDLPITWINSPLSKVNIIKDSLKMLLDVFKIKYYLFMGKYND